ncbi:hypothetical protein RhiirA4_538976 [Rhizophagus irregularis]|uniref:BTB domain-containing protein n=1 Tax=Rhizophagus irregularis TaxID=588596 RepID=A0A2I1G212_9GLOM|nr:hypothetical protein RhiirA4_538976 [Rhizophagus irregularis]
MQTEKDQLPRGRSLENDFGRLMNDEKFHDITLNCSDGMIHGCKVILAARSDVFNSSIFNESTKINNNLSFNDISSTAMKVILEFLYTSKVENLNVDNIVEVYYASVHFDLIDLQDHIIKFTKSLINGNVDVGRKLLSEYVENFSLRAEDNEMSRILINWVAKNKLEKSEIDSLSLEGLKYLLDKTFDTQIPFATPEFNIWEYTLVKVIRKLIQNKTLVEKILNEKSLSICDTKEIENVKNLLTPLIGYINLNRMDVEEIKQHVEPFNIHTIDKFKDVYRSKAMNEELGFIRGVPIFKWRNNKVDKQLITSDDEYTVKAVWKIEFASVLEDLVTLTHHKIILGDLIFKGEGIYEWDLLIRKLCGNIYIGICDINEDLTKTTSDQRYHGWVLGSDGYVYYKNEWKWYNAKFKEGDKVTVHLDMKNKTCAFSVNNIKKPIVSEWKKIPSHVYPIASLGVGSELRIEPHVNKN